MIPIKVDHTEYGLQESKAQEIASMFKPMLESMEYLEVQYNEIMTREIEPETIQMAHDLRLAYVKVRTGTDAIHKKLKDFYLQGGRFVDGWRNAQRMASQGNEEKLRAIEDHFKNKEIERIQRLQAARGLILEGYTTFIPDQLGEMADDVWDNYLAGVRLNYEAQKEAEKKALEERENKQKQEAARNERARKENYKLRKQAREREAAQAKEREEQEAKLKAEREAREKVEQELKDKQEAERRAQEAENKRIQAELGKDDHERVKDLLRELIALREKYQFKSDKYAGVGRGILMLIQDINTL